MVIYPLHTAAPLLRIIRLVAVFRVNNARGLRVKHEHAKHSEEADEEGDEVLFGEEASSVSVAGVESDELFMSVEKIKQPADQNDLSNPLLSLDKRDVAAAFAWNRKLSEKRLVLVLIGIIALCVVIDAIVEYEMQESERARERKRCLTFVAADLD